MTRYFADHPRNFSNEYTVYAVASGDVARFQRFFPNSEPVSRKRAVRLGWSRPREANRDGEQWFGGFAEPMVGHWDVPADAEAALALCREATVAAIDWAETMREADALAHA